MDDPANLASGKQSTSDVAGPSSLSLGPIRGRLPYLQVRTTPYEWSRESSSHSLSPLHQTFLGTLSPLLSLAHLSVQPIRFVVQNFIVHFSAAQDTVYVPNIGDLGGPFVALALSAAVVCYLIFIISEY